MEYGGSSAEMFQEKNGGGLGIVREARFLMTKDRFIVAIVRYWL